MHKFKDFRRKAINGHFFSYPSHFSKIGYLVVCALSDTLPGPLIDFLLHINPLFQLVFMDYRFKSASLVLFSPAYSINTSSLLNGIGLTGLRVLRFM